MTYRIILDLIDYKNDNQHLQVGFFLADKQMIEGEIK